MATKSPLRAILQGLAAGAVGTAVVTVYRERAGGGGGEQAAPPSHWGEAPEPAQVGQRVAEGVFEHELPLERAPALTHAVHWLYGTAWGAFYGILQESIGQPVVSAAALAGTVTATDYTLLPAMHIRESPSTYPPERFANDAAMHLVYGLAVAGAYLALDHV